MFLFYRCRLAGPVVTVEFSPQTTFAYGMVWHGMAWYGMAWHGMAWCGMACAVLLLGHT